VEVGSSGQRASAVSRHHVAGSSEQRGSAGFEYCAAAALASGQGVVAEAHGGRGLRQMLLGLLGERKLWGNILQLSKMLIAQ
jgi:hypothetical protein